MVGPVVVAVGPVGPVVGMVGPVGPVCNKKPGYYPG
jgi:hypothetical protein